MRLPIRNETGSQVWDGNQIRLRKKGMSGIWGRMMILIILCMLFMASSEAKTLTLGGSGDVRTLSEAIALAQPGDEILLGQGYYDGALVDRNISICGSSDAILGLPSVGALILAAPGCRISNLSIKAGGSGPALELQSSDCVIARCSLQGKATGISVTGKNNSVQDCQMDSPLCMEIKGSGCSVQNCTMRGDMGIKMTDSMLNRVQGCSVLTSQGMQIDASRLNRIENNTFSGMSFGASLSGSSENTIQGNNFSGSYVSGLDIADSIGNKVKCNRITGGKLGISLRRSEGNNLTANVCRKNERAGIYLDSSFENRLDGNELSGDGNGILLANSRDNLLRFNNASRNSYGISLRGSTRMILQGNNMSGNEYNLRIDAGDLTDGSSGHYFYLHEIDSTNLVDGKTVSYIVGKANVEVPSGSGFVGLVSCRNALIANQNISNSSAGMLIINCTGIRIDGCNISRCESGVDLLNSTIWSVNGIRAADCKTGFAAQGSINGLFERDLASNCSESGFRAEGSLNLTWQGCSAISNTKGLAISGSRLCSVNNCSVRESKDEGILLTNSHKCYLKGNNAFSNERGISLVSSNACQLLENNASSNKIDGISVMQLSSTDLLRNMARENGQGIFVQSSSHMKIDGNTLDHNSRYGLRMSGASRCNVTENSLVRNQIAGINLVDCTGNLIYHNVFTENGLQNAADNGENQWDLGPEIGGNYWSDHPVSGNPGNSSCKIPSSGVDRYPFQDPEGWR